MPGRGERVHKRLRRLSTDSEDQEEEYDWSDPRQQRGATGRAASSKAKAAPETNMSRARRTASGAQSAPLATVSRLPSSSPSSQQSLHLTVKLPSTKLRQATRMAPPARSSRPSTAVSSRDPFAGGEIIEGKRVRNVKKSYVLESDSDEEDDEDMEDIEDDEDAEGESLEEDDEEMADQDAEGEDDDADGDIDMEIPPPPPVIKVSRAEKSKKPVISAKPSGKSDSRIVEAKAAAELSDDEELSELESEVEEEDEEEEEGMQLGGEEDAEGEEEEIEVDEEDEEEDDDLDSDDETPAGGSRASTPDLTKLTKRQRARLDEGGSGHLLALPDEVQVKKHLTAEEHAMRRAEMARRRKNLSEKRNEEEKMETINKLLKKQAPKTNSRRRDFNGLGGADGLSEGEVQRASPVYVRWVSNREGNHIGVPEEWIEGPVGAVFGSSQATKGGRLIEEVQ